jgi:hypothetical protein
MDETSLFRRNFSNRTTKSQTAEKNRCHEHQKQIIRTQIRHQEQAGYQNGESAGCRHEARPAKYHRKAFDLAKSGGRELDLAFTLQPLTQSFPKPSNIRAAQLASF